MYQAIDAGLLKIEPVEGAHVEGVEPTSDLMMVDLLANMDDLLSQPGGRYPLFDQEANDLVRGGVELGYFNPVPHARR